MNKKLSGRSDFLDVEIFLIANGRLPTEKTDSLTREMVKKVLDMAMIDQNEKALKVMNYAFHLFHILGPNFKGDKATGLP